MHWLAPLLSVSPYDPETGKIIVAQAVAGNETTSQSVSDTFTGNQTALDAGSSGGSFSVDAAGTTFDIGLGLPPETLFVAGVAALAFSKGFERRHGEVGGTLAILAGVSIHAANVLRSIDEGSPFAFASLGVLAWCAWMFVAYRSSRLADGRQRGLDPPGSVPTVASAAGDGTKPAGGKGLGAASALAAFASPVLMLVGRIHQRAVAGFADQTVARDVALSPVQEWARSTWRTNLAVRFWCQREGSGLDQSAHVRGGAFYGLWFSRDSVEALARVEVEGSADGAWTVSEHGTLERSSGPVRVAIENTVSHGGGDGEDAWVTVTTRMRAALNAAEGPTLTATVGAVEVSGGLPDASKGVVCAFGTERWG